MVELRSVSKVYERRLGGRVHALRDASLRVESGEIIALVGPSGAGKSTLLRLLYGEEVPSSGRVLVGGDDVGALSRRGLARLRRRLGVIPQDPPLLADRTSFGNVTFVLRALGMSRRERRARALDMLRTVGLARKANAYPHELADGERRCLFAARALAHAPRLLLADEPAGTLEGGAAREVVGLLRAAHTQGTTVVVATRAAAFAEALGARAVLLDAGQVRYGVDADGLG